MFQIISTPKPRPLPIRWLLPGKLFIGEPANAGALEELVLGSVGSIDFYRMGNQDTVLFSQQDYDLKAAMLEFGDPQLGSVSFLCHPGKAIEELKFVAKENLAMQWSEEAIYDSEKDILHGTTIQLAADGYADSQQVRLGKDFFILLCQGSSEVLGWILQNASSYIGSQLGMESNTERESKKLIPLLTRYLELIEPKVLASMEEEDPQTRDWLISLQKALMMDNSGGAGEIQKEVNHLLDFWLKLMI